MAHAPQEGTNGQGKVYKQGETAKGKGTHGEVEGTISSFAGGSHQHAVIKKDGYTYIVDTRTLRDAD